MPRRYTDHEKPLPNVECAGVIAHLGKELLLLEGVGAAGYKFIKGHIETHETPETAAIREGQEEAGREFELIAYLGICQRLGFNANQQLEFKRIHMFAGVSREWLGQPELRPVWILPNAALPHMFPEEATFLEQHLATILSAPDSDC